MVQKRKIKRIIPNVTQSAENVFLLDPFSKSTFVIKTRGMTLHNTIMHYFLPCVILHTVCDLPLQIILVYLTKSQGPNF